MLDSVMTQNRVMNELSSESQNTCSEPKIAVSFAGLTKVKVWNAMQMQILLEVGTRVIQINGKMLCLELDTSFDMLDAPLCGAASCRLK